MNNRFVHPTPLHLGRHYWIFPDLSSMRIKLMADRSQSSAFIRDCTAFPLFAFYLTS